MKNYDYYCSYYATYTHTHSHTYRTKESSDVQSIVLENRNGKANKLAPHTAHSHGVRGCEKHNKRINETELIKR